LPLGQRRPGEGGVHHHEPRRDGDVEIRRREDTGDPGDGGRLRRVDRTQLGVGHGRADKDEVQNAGDVEVVDIGGPPEEDVGVLDPADGVAQQRSGGSHPVEPTGAERRPRPPVRYCRSIVPCPFTMIFVTGWMRQSPSSGSTSSKPPPNPSPLKPLPDRPTRLKEKVKTFDRLPGPVAVGNVNEKRPSPSPAKQVSGSLVPYRPSTPSVPGPVGTIPRTGPLQDTVPVSPPDLLSTAAGTTESPGWRAMAD